MLLQKVENGGWASLGGLRGDDFVMSVNGKPTPTVADLKAMLDQVRKEKPRRVVFFVRRGIHTLFCEIEPDYRLTINVGMAVELPSAIKPTIQFEESFMVKKLFCVACACVWRRERFWPKPRTAACRRGPQNPANLRQGHDYALAAVLSSRPRASRCRPRQEQKTQCAAAIIDPSGLAVTSLTNLNPQKAMAKIRIRRGGETQTLELDCQVQEVKYRLTDGTEVPARIVLKDEDLDLVFLAPQKPLDDADPSEDRGPFPRERRRTEAGNARSDRS